MVSFIKNFNDHQQKTNINKFGVKYILPPRKTEYNKYFLNISATFPRWKVASVHISEFIKSEAGKILKRMTIFYLAGIESGKESLLLQVHSVQG